MKYRRSLLLAPGSLGASGTRVIDINIDKPISRIEIKFDTTKVLSYMTAPGPANILKIELVDGSKVLHSLTGYENQALAYYSRGKIAMELGQHIAALSEEDTYTIDFGRHLWDRELAFVPGNFHNPQLRITWNRALADTSCVADSIQVWADIFDEAAISPIGFLQAIEHYGYTPSGADAFHTIGLPGDNVYRQILVRAHQDGKEPWYNIDEARFDEGTLDSIPFDFTNLEAYYTMMKGTWPMLETPFYVGVCTDTRVFYIPMTDWMASVGLIAYNVTNEPFESTDTMAGGKVTLDGSADTQMIGVARGYLPWNCFQFPMGRQSEIDDWYDPTGKKPRLRLRAGAGGGSGTCQVVIEELHRY